MKRSHKKETGFTRFAKKILILSFMAFVVGNVALTSYESTLNINTQKLEKEIAVIQGDIDGLDMKRQELASFNRLKSICDEKGYKYDQSNMTAAVTGVQRD